MKILFLIFVATLPSFTLNQSIFDFGSTFYQSPNIHRVRNEPKARSLGTGNYVLDFIGLVNKYGYPGEEHRLTTDDGYNLVLHRIPYSPVSSTRRVRPVVYLQHGLLGSSDMWVMKGSAKDLAFLLADAGYDVWIGNVRGNTYCRSHRNLSPAEPKFWDFSFHEMALMDLPATIDYILSETRQMNLVYVGYSMGTTMSYILLSEKPEYNEKMRLVVSLAPVAYWRHVPEDLFRSIAAWYSVQSSNPYELYPQTLDNYRLAKTWCVNGALTQPICENFISLISGNNNGQLDFALTPYMMKYFPAGTSSKTVSHYAQHVASQNFTMYNYGHRKNYYRYGSKYPPEYHVEAITAPVSLFYGDGDVMTTEIDTVELLRRLPNVIDHARISYRNWTHFDFVWAKDAKAIIYDRVLVLIRKYSPIS